MLLVKNGNGKAFNELYKRHAKDILNFFYRKLYQDEEKANDFLQDLFLKLIENPDIFNHKKRFRPWLYTVAYNMCKNEYRRNHVRGNKDYSYDLETIIAPTTFGLFENKYDKTNFMNILNQELELLSDKHKQTFNLRYKEFHSLKEIAFLMDCSIGTVKSRLFYACKELSKKLILFKPEKSN